MSGFAWAKEPMVDRICDLSPKVPLTALYGDISWVSTIPKEEFSKDGSRDNAYTQVQVRDNHFV